MAASPLGTWLVVGMVTSLFLALVGALDSYRYSLGLRLGFWSALCLTGALLAALLEFLLDRLPIGTGHRTLKWLALILLFAVVMTPIAFLANSLGGARPWGELLMYLQNSLVISSVFVAMRLLLHELRRARVLLAQGAEQASARRIVFMERLPLKLRQGRLRALCAEGHYVRAWTDLGSDLVLFRLKDAIGELRGLEGMQVHRSWWVARDAVQGVQRDNGRLWLLLEGDVRVPVSRPNVSRLRDAGWV